MLRIGEDPTARSDARPRRQFPNPTSRFPPIRANLSPYLGGELNCVIPSRLRGRDERSAGGDRCGVGVDPHQAGPAGSHGRDTLRPGSGDCPRSVAAPTAGRLRAGKARSLDAISARRRQVGWPKAGPGHKPRSRGEAPVSHSRRLPASGSKPRHAAHLRHRSLTSPVGPVEVSARPENP